MLHRLLLCTANGYVVPWSTLNQSMTKAVWLRKMHLVVPVSERGLVYY
jgi:hypothetical protein